MSWLTRTINGSAEGRSLLQALEQQRIRRSLSRRELAEQLDISPPYLSQLFTGDKPVRSVHLKSVFRTA